MTQDEALRIIDKLNLAEQASEYWGLSFPGGYIPYLAVFKGGEHHCSLNTKDNLIFIQALRDLADILEEIA